MKKTIAVALLAFAPACSLTGFAGDDNFGGDPTFQARASGKNRALSGGQAGFEDINGGVVSYSHDVEKFDGAGDPKDFSKKIRAYQQSRPFGDHGGFDSGYSGVPQHHSPHNKPAVLTHETKDTNKDGYVSGNFNDACGIFIGIGNSVSMPFGALFGDDTSCVKGVFLGDTFSSGVTEGTGDGAIVILNKDKEKDSPNALFDRLPFATRVALMNSVNTQTDITREGRLEVLKLNLTGLRVGNQSYSPINASVKVVGMRNIRVEAGNTGLRMAMGWMADRVAESLKKGDKIEGSVTINGSVTLTLEQLLAGRAMKNSPNVVEGLRAFASTGGLIDRAL